MEEVISTRALNAVRQMEGEAIESVWRKEASATKPFAKRPGVGGKVAVEMIAYGIWKGHLRRSDPTLMPSLSKAEYRQVCTLLYQLDPDFYSEYANLT